MKLPNEIHCQRCGNIVQTNDYESIIKLTSGLEGITEFEGITIHFSFCLKCKTPADADFPEVSVSQKREHIIQ